jgi:hypothetical protein
MTSINPADWRSVADIPGAPYPDAIAEYMERMMTDLARAESVDIRAALAAWSDIDGIADPANILRIKYENDGPQVRVDRDASMFTRAKETPPKVVLEVPTLIVIADKRHAGLAYDVPHYNGYRIPVDWRRHERTYTGERFTVALLHRDETAKIPPDVHTGTEVADYAPNMENSP